MGFPRHLSPACRRLRHRAKARLRELVPIENAAMPDRTVVEWDKDDLDALRMLKIDVLALGMLTCIRKGFELLRAHYGVGLRARRPSRPRTRPSTRCCAAPIRSACSRSRAGRRCRCCRGSSRAPSTIWSSRSRSSARARSRATWSTPICAAATAPSRSQFPSERAARAVLGKTLGVPLFQEQAMKIAIVAAGFTPAEADGLRRSMAAFRRSGQIERYHAKLVEGMAARGYERDFAERLLPARSRASAITASRRAMPPASRSWSTSRPGSSATTRTCSAPRSSTPSRWASTPRPSSCATRSTTASRCARSTSTTATGTARWSRASAAGR